MLLGVVNVMLYDCACNNVITYALVTFHVNRVCTVLHGREEDYIRPRSHFTYEGRRNLGSATALHALTKLAPLYLR
jgi:hypothetical protein